MHFNCAQLRAHHFCVIPIGILFTNDGLTLDNNNSKIFRGLDLSLDPDVVAAMDDDFDYEDPENELDDDFILKAMGEGEDNDDDDEGEEGSDQDWESDSDRMGGRSEDEDEDEVRKCLIYSS